MARPLLRLSEVIAQLQALHAEYGDVPVLLDDPDTGWPMVPEMGYTDGTAASGAWHAIGPCVTVSGGYGGTHTPMLPED